MLITSAVCVLHICHATLQINRKMLIRMHTIPFLVQNWSLDFVLQFEVDFVGQYGFIRNFPPNSNFSAFSFDIPSARIDKCFFQFSFYSSVFPGKNISFSSIICLRNQHHAS